MSVTTNGATEHVDVLIVGAGLSGVGAACHLRRNAAPAGRSPSSRPATTSAAPGTSSAIPGSAPTRTCSRSATRSGPGPGRGDRRRRRDPARTSTTPRASTASTSRSASAIASCAPSGPRADARWTVHAERTDTGETRDADLQLPLRLHRLLPLRRGLHAGLRGHGPLRRRRSSIRSTGRRTSTTPASGSSSSAAGRPRSPSSRRWPRRAAHVTMLQRSPSYMVRSRDRTRSPSPCGAAWAPRPPTRSCAGRMCCWQMLAFNARRRRPEVLEEARPQADRASSCREGYDVDTHFNPPTSRGTSASASCPDGDLFEAISRGRASIVTDRIEAFTETGAPARVREGARGRRHRHGDRTQPAAPRRHGRGGRRRGGRLLRARRLQGHDAERRPQHRHRRSATRTLPGPSSATSSRSTSAGCSTTWTATATPCARRRDPTRRFPPIRSSTSSQATSIARPEGCRGRARRRRGGCTRAISATSAC